jgi:hypothetical protein
MQTIATFGEIAEAKLIQSVLQGHGIEAVIPGEETATMAPPYLWASGGIKLQVAEADIAQARAVLASAEHGAAEAIEREQNEGGQ